MIERQSADIAIKNPSGQTIVTVPITEDSRRVVKLMESDYIELSFRLDTAYHIPVGSYIDDEIFGRFFITEEQLATCEQGAECYRYKLKFNAWYWLWSLKQNMLTSLPSVIKTGYFLVQNPTGNPQSKGYYKYDGQYVLTNDTTVEEDKNYYRRADIASTGRVRKEASWTLTADMKTHLREVMHNLLALHFINPPTVPVFTGQYKEIFFSNVESDGNGGYEVKVYAKYGVPYNTFFCIQYDYVTEEEYTETNYVAVLIRQGNHVSEYFTDDMQSGFVGFQSDTQYTIKQVTLATAVNDQTKEADVLWNNNGVIEECKDDTWIFSPTIISSGTVYEDVTYNFSQRGRSESLSVIKHSKMGIPRIEAGGWLFETEQGYSPRDTKKEWAARVVEGRRTYEDFTEEETDAFFNTYFSISEDIEERLNALTISYQSTDILSAIKQIADTFNCEYWVRTSASTFKVYFGKCEEGTAQPISYEEGQDIPLNAESITLNNDTSEKAQKLYVYGSQDNIPYSYRKELITRCIYRGTINNRLIAFFQVPNIVKGYKGFIDGLWFPHETALSELNISLDAQTVSVKEWQDGDNVSYEKLLGTAVYIPQGEYEVQGLSQGGSILDLLVNLSVNASVSSNTQTYTNDDEADSYSGTCYFGFVRNDYSEYMALTACSQSGYYHRSDNSSLARGGMDYSDGRWSPSYFPTKEDTVILKGGYYYLAVWGTMSDDFYTIRPDTGTVRIKEGGISLTFHGTSIGSTSTNVEYEGKKFRITQNPFFKSKPSIVTQLPDNIGSNSDMIYFASQIPSEMNVAVGDTVIFLDSDSIDIPTQYYTTPYNDATSLYRIGERRLMLPVNTNPDNSLFWDNEDNPQWVCVNGAILPYAFRNDADNKNLQEATVTFDKVYPDGKMKVSEVIPEDMDTKEETSGEIEKYSWKWRQYHIHLVTANGGELTFKEEYILQGYQLSIRFLSPSDLTQEQRDTSPATDTVNGCKLAGMQFEDNFEEDRATYKPSGFDITIPTEDGQSITDGTSTYTNQDLLQDHIIARNDDFGAKLPNDILYPTTGDPVCLINWDVRALSSLGLIEDAERRLMQKAFEYAQALTEGNFTFECTMMSDFFFDMAGRAQTFSTEQTGRRPLTDSDGLYLYVKNGYSSYGIPPLGQRVTIYHQGLATGEKETRVIGMELKLDKPYDTPKLTCGETPAYSRLKQIEKEITKSK